MTQREIPGFYYDAEKAKYFRIQQNHIAPQGAKYSEENVRKEKEQSRKRKRSAVIQQKRQTQTVKRSAVLNSPSVAGIALWREQGRSHFTNSEARLSAIATQFQGYESLSLKSCESCGKRDNIHDFFVDDDADAVVLALGSRNFGRVQHLGGESSVYDLAAFRSDISSLTISPSRTLVATAYDRNHPGNVYVAGMVGRHDHDGAPPILDVPAPTYLMLGGPETTLWTSSASPLGAPDAIAVGASDGIYMLNSHGDVTQTFPLREDIRSIDWLSPTVAFGGTKSGQVYLWDARTGGSSMRFRHPSSVAGARSLGDGSRVLVAGAKGASVYDVRMTNSRKRGRNAPSTPFLEMASLTTQLPSLPMEIWPDAQLLATTDDENVVQLHSLSSGKLIGGLKGTSPARENGRITRLRFHRFADDRPTLIACQGSRLFEWSWGGAEDNED